MADELETALGKRFIQRRDAKAIQGNNGAYYVHTQDMKDPKAPRIGWRMQDLRDHTRGVQSYGHYLVGQDGLTKLFAFDLDLTKEGYWIDLQSGEGFVEGAQPCNPREVWLQKDHPGRQFLTIALRTMAESIAMKAKTMYEDDIHVALAYSGSKGLHVYGFLPEAIPAADARAAAHDVLKNMNEPDGTRSWALIKGENFYGATRGEKKNVEIEVFPKQDNLDGKDLGNLMRLPLGVNRKSGHRSFFLDCRCGYDQLRMMDPLDVLNGELPWD